MRQLYSTFGLIGSLTLLGACTPALSVEDSCDEALGYIGEGLDLIDGALPDIGEDADWTQVNTYGERITRVSAGLDGLSIGDEELSETVGDLATSFGDIGAVLEEADSNEDFQAILEFTPGIDIALAGLQRQCD